MNAPRQLGLVSATALVIASMIGTGVFTTSGFLLADLKSPWLVLGAWGAGGIIAGLGALCYGALARRIPESGGEYIFLSRTLHPAAGCLAGWVSLLVGFSAPLAATALAFAEYTNPWFPGLPRPVVATGVVIFFSIIHSWKVRGGALVQNLSVAFKLAALGAFLTIAASKIRSVAPPGDFDFSPGAFAVSLVWVSFSYAGWNAAVYIGGELRDPEQTLPRAMLLGTAITTLLYLLLNAVFVFSAPVDKLANSLVVARVAAEHLGGPSLERGVTIVIALALATSVSSLIMAGPRVYVRMAQDGYLPKALLSEREAPARGIALQAAISIVLLWSAAYTALLTYIGFTLGLSTAATVLGLMRLRLKEGERLPVPGWPWVPILFVGIVLLITAFTIVRQPVESAFGLGTLLFGWAVWWSFHRQPAKTPH